MKYKYWTKDRCFEEIKKYNSKKEFIKNAPGAFTALRRNGWIKEVWGNYENLKGNLKNRCVYTYEFSDNSIYIGITSNIEERNKNHFRYKSAVNQHCKKSGLSPKLKVITDYIELEKAIELEKELIFDYKKLNWNVLNKTNGGEIGCGKMFWTKEKCIEIAKSCKTKNEFLKKYHGAWSSAKKNNWLIEIQSYFLEIMKPSGFWTKENCLLEAKKYNSISEFRTKSVSAYTTSHRNGWFYEITQHMNLN